MEPDTRRIRKRKNISAVNLAVIFLLIEFFDELHYGAQGAALPSMRTDLTLTYAQIGLLLGLPMIINTLIEPFLMLLGDSSWRKGLVIGGGVVIIFSLLLIASAQTFLPLLIAFIISYPASGAFVTLSQATLMDLNPGREPHMMARWTVFGSFGNLVGPMIIAAAFAIGLGWRLPYLGLACLAFGLLIAVWRRPFPPRHQTLEEHAPSLSKTPAWMWKNLLEALRVRSLLRWVILLEFGDLMLDVLTSYLALYFSDVAGLNPTQTGLVLSLLMLSSLGADLLLIPLLERIPGRTIVRRTAAISIPLYIAFLTVPAAWVKIILMVGLRFSTMGWYQVMQGEAYASVPGRSGTVMAVNSAAGLIGGVLVWLIGVTANQAGLPTAMWLLLAAPLALLIFVPRPTKTTVSGAEGT